MFNQPLKLFDHVTIYNDDYHNYICVSRYFVILVWAQNRLNCSFILVVQSLLGSDVYNYLTIKNFRQKMFILIIFKRIVIIVYVYFYHKLIVVNIRKNFNYGIIPVCLL